MTTLYRTVVLGLLVLALSPAAAEAQFFGTFSGRTASFGAGGGWGGPTWPPLAGTPYGHLHGMPWSWGYPATYSSGVPTRYVTPSYTYGTLTGLPWDRLSADAYLPYTTGDYVAPPRARLSLYPAIPYRELADDESRAYLDVRVPSAGATLYLNNVATEQTGFDRTFATPPLARGTTYAYDVRAVWQDAGGQVQSRTRRVEVRAGERKLVDLGGGL